MPLDDRLLKHVQFGVAVRRWERGKPLEPLPPREPWPELRRAWRGPEVPFIETAYRSILGRDADADGVRGFRAALGDGMPRSELVRRLLESDEAKRHPIVSGWQEEMYRLDAVEPLTIQSYLLNVPDPREFVVQSYRRLLGRDPGPREVRGWLRRFRLPILGRRPRLFRCLERSRERAALMRRVETERLDWQFQDVYDAVRDTAEKLDEPPPLQKPDQRGEIERHTLALKRHAPRDEAIQKRLRAIQKSISNLELLTRGLRPERPVGIRLVPTGRVSDPMAACGLCGGTTEEDATRSDYRHCPECDLRILAVADAMELAQSVPTAAFAGFGYLTALEGAGLWPAAGRYLEVEGDGLLTEMLRDCGLDAWLYHRPEHLPAFAHEFRRSELDDFETESFDAVAAFGVFDRLAEPVPLGESLRRRLKPGGTAVLSLSRVAETGPSGEIDVEPLALWSRRALSHFAGQLGFESVGYLESSTSLVAVFSPLARLELEARLRDARAILRSGEYVVESILPWFRAGLSTRSAAEEARPIRGRGGLRCAS